MGQRRLRCDRGRAARRQDRGVLMAPYWNERRVDCLRRLAQQGCTIEEIGEVFRDATAQRIVSKLTRMRLKVADTRKLTIPLSASEERALSDGQQYLANPIAKDLRFCVRKVRAS